MELKRFPGSLNKVQKEVFIYALFSVLFHQSGYLLIFFLVPLQVLRNKKGFRSMFQGCIIVLAVIFIAALTKTSDIKPLTARMVLISSELFIPFVLFSGFLYINYNWPGNPRMLKKVLIVTAGAFMAGIPALLIYNSHSFVNFYKSQIALALELLDKAFSEVQTIEASEMAAVIKSLDAETVYEVVIKTVMRGYLFSYFIMISGSWWLGSSGFRHGRWRSIFKPELFRLPEFLVWSLITSLSIVILDYRINTGFIGYLGWNVLLIMVTLYGFRGLGILQGFMAAANLPAGLRVLIIFTLVLLLMQPGLKYAILIGIPALGVSEIWINYKRT